MLPTKQGILYETIIRSQNPHMHLVSRALSGILYTLNQLRLLEGPQTAALLDFLFLWGALCGVQKMKIDACGLSQRVR
jgi:hypothetical protein